VPFSRRPLSRISRRPPEAASTSFARSRRPTATHARPCSSGRWASRSTFAARRAFRGSSTSPSPVANVGRAGAGLMPIRGHSGVQGGAEWAHTRPHSPAAPRSRRRTHARSPSGTASDVPARRASPRRDGRGGRARRDRCPLVERPATFSKRSRTRLGPQGARRTPLRVHQDIVVSPQMLVDGEEVLLLPAMTRYEQPGGGTETTTERRVVLSPENTRAASGGGARGVGDLRGRRPARPSGANGGPRPRIRRGDPRGDRHCRPVLRGDRTPPGGRRLLSMGRASPLRGLALSDSGRRAPVLRRRARLGVFAGRPVPPLDAAGKAVQLHGLAGSRSAD